MPAVGTHKMPQLRVIMLTEHPGLQQIIMMIAERAPENACGITIAVKVHRGIHGGDQVFLIRFLELTIQLSCPLCQGRAVVSELRTCIATLWTIPNAIIMASRELPPALTKGKGMPATGKSPTFMPIFMTTWKKTISITP